MCISISRVILSSPPRCPRFTHINILNLNITLKLTLGSIEVLPTSKFQVL